MLKTLWGPFESYSIFDPHLCHLDYEIGMAHTNYFHANYQLKLIGLFSVVDLFNIAYWTCFW